MRGVPLLLFLAALAGGCAGRDIDAPSLGPRAVERQPIAAPDAASEPQVPADAALTGRIAAIETVARQGHAEFERARARAAIAVGRAGGASAGSESWTAAQQELSALDAARAPVSHAAADIDALRQEPASAASGNRAAIEAAAARVEALSQAEAADFASLSARLPS